MPDIVFGAPQWWVAVLIACVVLFVGVAWSYRSTLRSRPILIVALLLKVLGIGLLGICLLEPMIRKEKPRSQANIFAVLSDNSQSMLIGSKENIDAQREKLQKLLSSETDWQSRLSQDFRVRRYRFDERIEPVEELGNQDFSGAASELNSALADLAQRFPNAPVAGAILISDGNATDASKPVNWSELGFPVFPVLLSRERTSDDVRIDSMTVRQSDFETAPVSVDVQIAGNGLSGRSAIVHLVDQENQVIEKQSIKLPEPGRTQACQFRFRPKQSGVSSYRAQVFLESEAERAAKGTTSEEATLANNSRQFTVDRGSERFRILYVAGRPNWEHKFLRRALEEDDELRLVSLIRIARKEPKFSFRDTNVDSSNPLFSGFKDISQEEKEQFDQPVLVRMGVLDGEQLSKGFPVTAEELFSYQAIILDDLESEFFSHDQMLLLRQFVTQRGGGLLVLGGQESLSGREFQDSPLGELMPVYVDESIAEQKKETEPQQFVLTREGWLEPFLRVKENEVNERERLAEMPAFSVLNAIRGVKPGASVLAEATSGEGSRPVFVTQRFGKGRTAGFLIGDMWRWAMHQQSANESPLFQSWRQIVRWMISDVPTRVQTRLSEDQSSRSSSEIMITALDDRYELLDNAQVSVKIKKPDGSTVELLAQTSAEVPGTYQANLMTRETGVYLADIEVRAPDGSLVGKDQLGWVSEPAQGEFQSIEPNRAFLDEIANKTGGRVIHADELASFADNIPANKIPIVETWQIPLWHQPWVLALAVACLCGEWGLRRRSGLA
jgi:uncharacterized membrane protein